MSHLRRESVPVRRLYPSRSARRIISRRDRPNVLRYDLFARDRAKRTSFIVGFYSCISNYQRNIKGFSERVRLFYILSYVGS